MKSKSIWVGVALTLLAAAGVSFYIERAAKVSSRTRAFTVMSLLLGDIQSFTAREGRLPSNQQDLTAGGGIDPSESRWRCVSTITAGPGGRWITVGVAPLDKNGTSMSSNALEVTLGTVDSDGLLIAGTDAWYRGADEAIHSLP